MKTQQFIRTKSANSKFSRIVALGPDMHIDTVILFWEPGIDDRAITPANKTLHIVSSSETHSTFGFMVKLINNLPDPASRTLEQLKIPGCLCREIFLS